MGKIKAIIVLGVALTAGIFAFNSKPTDYNDISGMVATEKRGRGFYEVNLVNHNLSEARFGKNLIVRLYGSRSDLDQLDRRYDSGNTFRILQARSNWRYDPFKGYDLSIDL